MDFRPSGQMARRRAASLCRSCGGLRVGQLVQILSLSLRVILEGLMAPSIPQCQRCPEAFVVRVVDGVGIADEPDSGACVLRPPRLCIFA